ncbi:DNA-binding PucR family transcriptional regulator [Halopolyspora algeriensis]|uniref:DNA-binding PucR family transcriptional regulator n=1 Tax=Halopolyspora algeriensis TaxID=1500506 RepID=A0A368VII6_9ACTN|nr:helix-turn-helix domain-containing protein [Halopolyspora algeriensis]RCW41021.1 DNA-binding PucR family transcriptional regulator [Halopolyspora algeriensis]TQM53895.1 DNA-binding PucR family transcriptional regulator [Halopolyspora algeriensis]
MSGALERRLVPADDPGAEEVFSLAALVSARLQHRFAELNASMNTAIEDAIESLDDPELTDMLHASVEGNIATILHMIGNNIPLEHMQPITAATEYAIRLARAGVPSASLRRAYHIGSDDMLANMFEEIQQLDCSSDLKLRLLHHLAGWMHKYVDWITGVVLDAHEQERRALLERAASETSTLVHRVLERHTMNAAEFAAKTGYRLDQTHIAAVLWIEGISQGADQADVLSSLATTVATALGSVVPPLCTPVDRSTAWVWIGGVNAPSIDAVRSHPAVRKMRGIRLAIGKPAPGVEGFRHSHEQAEAIKGVASVASPPQGRLAYYGDDGVVIVAMLARDLSATRRWVGEVLGPLGADTEAAERLRETVRVFLRTGDNYVKTSKELALHRNTVKYRLEKAEKERGRLLEDGRFDLDLALQVCHLLGHVVLKPQPDSAGVTRMT